MTSGTVGLALVALGLTSPTIAATAVAADVPFDMTGQVSDQITHQNLPGITVELLLVGALEPADLLAQTVTDSRGAYSFEVPRNWEGRARVRFTDPTGWYATQYSYASTYTDTAAIFSMQLGGNFQAHGALVPVGWYVPIDPVRVLDTRTDDGGPVRAGETISQFLGPVGADVTAVVLNITTTGATSRTSFVSAAKAGAWPGKPLTSVVNARGGFDIANLAVVALGPAQDVELYNDQGSVDLAVDLQGYYTASGGAGYTPITPTRVLDTRVAGAAFGAFGASERRLVDVSGPEAAMPTGAVAIAINLTSTGATASSYVSAYAVGDPDGPLTSVLNTYPGQNVPNLAIVPVVDGAIELYNNRGQTDLVVDIQGWYTADGGAGFLPTDPRRTTLSDGGPLGPGQSRDEIDPGNQIAPPLGAVAAALNITTTSATAPSSFLTVYPAGRPRPLASSVNTQAGVDRANSAVVWLGPGYSIYNDAGSVQPLVDVMGYFLVPPAP